MSLLRELLSSLRVIADPANCLEVAQELLGKLAFVLLALNAFISFVLIFIVAIISAYPEKIPVAPIRACSIAHTVVFMVFFAICSMLYIRIYYFKHHPLRSPRTGYVQPGADIEGNVDYYSQASQCADPKASELDSSFQEVELSNARARRSQAPSPYDPGQEHLPPASHQDPYRRSGETSSNRSEYRVSTVSTIGRPSSEVSTSFSSFAQRASSRLSQMDMARNDTRKHFSREANVGAGDRPGDIDIDDGRSQYSTRESALSRRGSSFEIAPVEEVRSDARRYPNYSAPGAYRQVSVRGVLED
ncbi:hypothetical protein F5B20DRAFT_575005 [Whalleya microplaca]|nr:hypothetical protein F5B20DRAFT_575005 [Whalleya microplaca]